MEKDTINHFPEISDIPTHNTKCICAYQIYKSIVKLPEKEQKRYVLQKGKLYYDGFVFSEKNVLYINLLFFDENNKYESSPIDITPTFKHFEKIIDPYFLCNLIRSILFNTQKLCNYTEQNVVPLLHEYQSTSKEEIAQKIKRHKNKHGKFVGNCKSTNNQFWNNLLIERIIELGDENTLKSKYGYHLGNLYMVPYNRIERGYINRNKESITKSK